MNSLPKKAIKALNQWLHRHSSFLFSALQSKNNSFSCSNTDVFYGPFTDETGYLMIEEWSKNPKMYITWDPDKSSMLEICFKLEIFIDPKVEAQKDF
jgi:hypothetical protein